MLPKLDISWQSCDQSESCTYSLHRKTKAFNYYLYYLLVSVEDCSNHGAEAGPNVHIPKQLIP